MLPYTCPLETYNIDFQTDSFRFPVHELSFLDTDVIPNAVFGDAKLFLNVHSVKLKAEN